MQLWLASQPRYGSMILYLVKRTKPECPTAVAYIATGVNKCTVDDVEKLQRLVLYIHGTRDSGVMMKPGAGGLSVRLFMDASYGVHSDRRSHTRSCVVIGDVGVVHCRSSKQLIVTKSSTEAELLGLSDSANQGIHIWSFLTARGYTVGPVTIYQDNQSCMALVERGRSDAERMRHIHTRYFWVKEQVDTGEVRVEYLPSEDMYANVLTKPLQGSQFKRERDGLTGWTEGPMATSACDPEGGTTIARENFRLDTTALHINSFLLNYFPPCRTI